MAVENGSGETRTWKSTLFAHDDVDIFRDTPIRYLGYANEVGEAFKSHVPRTLYYGSYLLASSYCLADSVSKGKHIYEEKTYLPVSLRRRYTVETIAEAAVWQGLASVIIPGFTINRICLASGYVLCRVGRNIPLRAQTWITTVIGLSMIPVIIKPIDRGVDQVMELTLNKLRKVGIVHKP
ncbi:predicted protein [Nematostella vectensis]|uniref:Mitochondrial fission process protein 1 n=1 Tax=Nematostella vectensis TaxID=45351 RepID=A7S533_NEMVE|nr:mitochondrial fission process protein 1 [Nematostella vectensis]EDO41135.1 predicted protein [Nematostella vectensis]|eukprot:XP_001633198.1 predicted protein [Nematostella vectensis]